MKDNPVGIERYFFTDQSVTAVREFTPEAEQAMKSHTRINSVHPVHSDDGARRFGCEVTVESLEESVNPSYTYRITAYGIFRIQDDDLDFTEALEGIGKLSAVQLLIGAIRERLLDLTARGPWGEVTMQVISIHPEKKEVQSDE